MTLMVQQKQSLSHGSRMQQNHDQTYCELLQLCQSGFPRDSSQLTNTLRPFWKIHNDLYIVDNLLMYGNRLVIPASLRKEVLECLHAAHQGVAGMKARDAACVYWPGISADISNRRIQCRTCNTIAPSQAKLPLHPPSAPVYPFEQVVADYFTLHGHDYLVYADRYTGWVTVSKAPTSGKHRNSSHTRVTYCIQPIWCPNGARN